MTRAEILALGTQTATRFIKASDTGTMFLIPDGGDGTDAVAVVTSNPLAYSGTTVIENMIGITKAGYDAIGSPNANTEFKITDAPLSEYAAPVIGEWNADTGSTVATPDAGQLRWNHATQTSATALYLDMATAGTIDMTAMFLLVATGDKILLQAGVSNYQIWRITGAPSVSTGNWTFPVELVSSAGTGTTGFADETRLIVATRGAGEKRLITDYVAPQTLTSSASISMDVTAGVNADLAHGHNTTITLSNLKDGQSGTIRATTTVSLMSVVLAHAGLTLIEMGGDMGTIASVNSGSKWSIAYQRVGSELWTYTTIKV